MQFEIDFSQQDGLWVFQETLAKMQSSYKDTIAAAIAIFGDKIIMSGCDVSGANITSGWIIYGGELLPFVGGTAKARVVLNSIVGTEFFDDGSQKPVYTSKSLVFADSGGFAFADLKRATPYQNIWVKGDIKDVVCDANYIATNFDASGLGKNERLGWAVMNGQNGTIDAGGRVTVGYSTVTVDPGDNVWDSIYNTVGVMAGEKQHVLTQSELPKVDLKSEAIGNKGWPKQSGDRTGANSNDAYLLNNPNSANGSRQLSISLGGANEPHENRQPFFVTLKIMHL